MTRDFKGHINIFNNAEIFHRYEMLYLFEIGGKAELAILIVFFYTNLHTFKYLLMDRKSFARGSVADHNVIRANCMYLLKYETQLENVKVLLNLCLIGN